MKATKKLILVAVLAAVLPVTASADGYLVDSTGSIYKDISGECWHTSIWNPSMAVKGCDAVAVVGEEEIAPLPPKSASVDTDIFSRKLTFTEEDFFGFDKAELRPKGKTKLDNMVHDLKDTKYEVIHVIGYTDRIGSAGYNLKLSMLRADEVKVYLVNKGIPADRIKAEGKGETQPNTNPADCKGKSSAENIACLQPDRRTEVSVDAIKVSEAGSR
jgi:OmpA-OmpF porin, OOP family